MLKLIVRTVATILILCLFVTSCASSFDPSVYRYVDAMNHPEFKGVKYPQPTYIEPYEDESYTKLLKLSKEQILGTNLKTLYPYFHWDKLDSCQIKGCKGAMIEGRERIFGASAHFDDATNTVYIYPYYDKNMINGIIIHELIHCLTYAERDQGSKYIDEAIADYFSMSICKCYGISYKCAYIFEEVVLYMYFELLSEEETVKRYFEGTLFSDFEQYTQEGMMIKLSCAMELSKYAVYQNEELDFLRVVQDIMCHYARNYCEGMPNKERRQKLENCKGVLYLKEEYFMKLLK